MKNFIFISLFLFSYLVSFAQVQNYTFSASSGTYTPITGGTVVTSGTIDAFYTTTAITNIAFTYNCTAVTSLRINADGHISLGNLGGTSTTNYTPLSGTINANIGTLSVLGRDLASTDVVGANPEIRYETVGDEFIVQWTDMRRSGTTGERISFQIRINTVTNVIKYVYGSYTAGAANANQPQIGLKGINNTFPANVNNVTLACGATGWLGITAGTANNSTVCLSSVTFPASGTTFTWTPPAGPATPGAITGAATLCNGATSQTYSVGAVAGATTYTWTVPTGWTITSGSGTNSITVTPGTTGQNGNITVTAGSACGTSAASTLAVSVVASPTISSQPLASQTICVGGSIPSPLTVAYTNGTGTPTYQWYLVGSPDQAITGATNSSFTPTAFSTAGTYSYYAIVTLAGCGSVTSNNASVLVVADPTVAINSSASYCQNSSSVTPISVSVSGGQGTSSYQWYSNTSNNTTSGTLISAATSQTYSPSVSTVGTLYYYSVVTQSGVNCSATSSTVSIQVVTPPSVSTQPLATQTKCVGGTPTNLNVATSGGTGTPTYQWYSNTTNSTTGGTAISGATSSTYTPSSATAGTTYYYCIISFSSGGCSTVTSNLATVIVNANPTVTGTTSLCVGSTGQLIGSGTPAASNAWVSSNASVATVSNTGLVTGLAAGTATITYTNNNGCSAISVVTVNANPTANAGADGTITCTQNTSGITLGISSVTGVTYAWSPSTGLSANNVSNPISTTTTTTTYTLTSTNSVSGCTATDQVIVTVNITPPVANAGADFTKTCTQNPNGLQIGTTAVSGVNYSWSPITGLSSSTVSNPTANPTTTTTYTLTATNTANGCTAADQVVVTVNNTPPVANAGADFTKTCTQNPNGLQIGTTAVSGVNYSWSPITGLSSSTVSNPTANPTTTTTYTLTATNPANGCTATDQVIVTVNNTSPVANAGADFNKTCTQNPNGTTIGSSSVAGVTYAWSPATGLSSTTLSNPLANPSSTTTYTVTVTNTASGCTATDIVVVTVDNTPPTANAGSDFTKTCTQNINGLQIGMSAISGVTYSWTPSSGLSATNISNPIANPITTTTYTLTASNTVNGCTAADQVIVTVSNTPPTITGSTSLCVGGTSQLTGTATAATTNAWVSSNTSVATVSNTGLVTALTSGTTIISYTNNNGCQASATITVTTSPSASISYVGSPFCSSLTAAQPVTLTGTTGGTYSSTAGLSLSTSTGTITPSSSTPGTYTITYTTPASGGCSAITTTTTVTITAAPTASISYSGNSFCSSVSTAQSVTLTGTGSYTGGTYISAPSGLTINTTTGAITPSTSTPGTYTITYTTLASGGCSGITATTQVTVSAVPTASISYTGSPYCNTIASSQSVTLIGTGSYTGGVYSSTAGLTINPSTGSITPSTSSQGTYIINYTTPASGGCSAITTSTTATITAAPTASISYSGSPFCNTVTTAQSVSLIGTGSYTGGTYSSAPSGLIINTTIGAITPSTSVPGTYTITYTTLASGGCPSVTTTTSVTITEAPTASISYSSNNFCNSITSSQPVSLTGIGSYTGGTYSSSTGLSLSASSGAITPSTSTPGTYTIIYTTPASEGCSSVTTSTTVTINPSVGTTGAISGNTAQCPGTTGQTYSISAVTNATTYTWTVPTGWIITAGQGTNNITVTAGNAGQNGDITVTAENSCGISSPATLAVTVSNAVPTTPSSISGNATLCSGATSQTYSISAVTNATTYNWTVPTGWTISSGASTNSIIVTPGTAGQNGIITVTAGNSCGTSQGSTLQVSVNPLPSVNAGSDTTVCEIDLPVSITATGNASSYSWNTGANTATTTISAAGTYTVTGTLNGCSSSDNIVISTDPCAGIEENKELSFQLYPNPSNSVIHLTANSNEQFNYSIYSIEGKLILVGVINNGTTSLSVGKFAPGKYFTKIGANVIAFEVIP